MNIHLPDAPRPEAPREFNDLDGASTASRSPAARSRLGVAIAPRSMWVAAGIVLAVLALVLLLTKALGALVIIFLSIILAEAIRPLVARLQRHRIPQPLAILLIYVCAAAIIGGLLWLVINPIVTEVGELGSQFPTYIAHIQQWFVETEHNLSKNPAALNTVQQMSAALANWAQQALPSLIHVPLGLLAGLFGLFINAVIVLTLALFWLGCTARLKAFVVGLFPPEKREMVSHVTTKMSRSLGGWVLGTLIAMFLIGSLTGLGLLIVGVPYALLLGVLAAFTELIPYLGPWISGSVAVVVTLVTTGDPLTVVWVIVLFLIIQEVEGNVIEPLVMHKAVKLDPWLVLVAIVVGGELLGLIGVILAVPVAAVLQVVTLEVVAPAIRTVTNSSSSPSLTDQVALAHPAPQVVPTDARAPDNARADGQNAIKHDE